MAHWVPLLHGVPVVLGLLMGIAVGCSLLVRADGLANGSDGGRDGNEGVASTSNTGDRTDGGGNETPVIVASLVTNPRGLAAQPATGDLYWTQHQVDGTGTINHVSAGGSTSVVVYNTANFPSEIAVDDRHLYWASDDPQYQEMDWAPLEPGSFARFTETGGAVPVALALDDARFYWAAPRGQYGAVLVMPKNGPGPGTPIDLGTNAVSMAVDPNSHVVAVADEHGGIFYAVGNQSSSTFAPIATDQSPRAGAIAIRGSVIYWANVDGTIWTADPATGVSAHVFIGGQGTIGGVAVDDARVYWTVQGMRGDGGPPMTGEVRAVPASLATPPRTLATRQLVPTAIAVTERDVFWLNVGETDQPNGSVMRLAK